MYQSSTATPTPVTKICVPYQQGISTRKKPPMYRQFVPTSFSGNNQQPPLRQKAFPED